MVKELQDLDKYRFVVLYEDDGTRHEHYVETNGTRDLLHVTVLPPEDELLVLRCVITQGRLKTPAKGKDCTHLSYCNTEALKTHASQDRCCPIPGCAASAALRGARDVVSDERLGEALRRVPESVEHVTVRGDGQVTWEVQSQEQSVRVDLTDGHEIAAPQNIKREQEDIGNDDVEGEDGDEGEDGSATLAPLSAPLLWTPGSDDIKWAEVLYLNNILSADLHDWIFGTPEFEQAFPWLPTKADRFQAKAYLYYLRDAVSMGGMPNSPVRAHLERLRKKTSSVELISLNGPRAKRARGQGASTNAGVWAPEKEEPAFYTDNNRNIVH